MVKMNFSLNWSKATRAEKARWLHESPKAKVTVLRKTPKNGAGEITCPFCNLPDNRFKPGDAVKCSPDKSRIGHVSCVKREYARASAVEGGNILDKVLEKEFAEPLPKLKKDQYVQELPRSQGRPETLSIKVGGIEITIKFTEDK